MPNPGFTLAEDAALKSRLSHLSVSDDRNAERIANVFFRYPEGETEKEYPFITIDLVDIAYDGMRQESERRYYYADPDGDSAAITNMNYSPSELTASGMTALAGADGIIATDQYVPVNLIYQVTTYCRSQRHDRQLTMLLMRRVFPLRRGYIDIPEDGTIRRCDLLDWRSNDVLDQETGYKKRIFRKVLTVRVNAELPQTDFLAVQQVLEVNGTLGNYEPGTPAFTNSFTEDF